MQAASKACRHAIKNEEGWKLVPYICPAGKWTVGAGHRLYPKDKVPGLIFALNHWVGKISEETAEKLLTNDLAIAEKAINELVKVPLKQNQFDSLCSFILNVGRQAFAGSTMLRLLNQHKYELAAQEFKRWVKDDHGNKIPGLVARRDRERVIFEKP